MAVEGTSSGGVNPYMAAAGMGLQALAQAEASRQERERFNKQMKYEEAASRLDRQQQALSRIYQVAALMRQ